MVPVSGSAYTYAYATLGELVAWIIGWDLILEYAVGNVAVAMTRPAMVRSKRRVSAEGATLAPAAGVASWGMTGSVTT